MSQPHPIGGFHKNALRHNHPGDPPAHTSPTVAPAASDQKRQDSAKPHPDMAIAPTGWPLPHPGGTTNEYPQPETEPQPTPPRIITGPNPTGQFWAAHSTGDLIGLRTSGSTGMARTIVRTTSSWVDSFQLVNTKLCLGSTDRMWIPGPLESTMNLFSACICEYFGATWSVDGAGASHATLTPHGLAQAIETQPPMTALVAGDGLSRALAARAISRGWRVLHYYGAAELSLVAWGEHAEDLSPFPGVEIVTPGDEIWVRSPWLSLGYLGQTSHPAFTWGQGDLAGFASVGDRGRLIGSNQAPHPAGILPAPACTGHRLVVWGRAGAITTGGATIALAPVQAQLQAQISGEIILVGIDHPSLGQVLAALLTEADDLEVARAWARAHLPPAQRPRRWRILSVLPRTPAGKIDTSRLAEIFS